MNPKEPENKIALGNGLDLRQVVTKGSILHVDEVYNDDPWSELNVPSPSHKSNDVVEDPIGKPISNFKNIRSQMFRLDDKGLVYKKVLYEGGGLLPNEDYTVSIAYSGYLEGHDQPFDLKLPCLPLVVDLNDNGLLPGLEMAVKSMLVGEKAVFLMSWEVMYGELGVPPRIPPKTDVLFYIMVIRSIITPREELLEHHEPNSFVVQYREVKWLFASGSTLYKTKNFPAAIQLFRKAINILHKCRLADEQEQEKQEKMLIKLYMNTAICYNYTKQPLRACTACNELNRLNALWKNGKALFQNGKALLMIGDKNGARKRLERALKLCPDKEEIQEEIDKLNNLDKCESEKDLLSLQVTDPRDSLQVNDEFISEVDSLLKVFKEYTDCTELTLPENLNSAEIEHIKKACEREKLYFSQIDTGNFLHRTNQTFN